MSALLFIELLLSAAIVVLLVPTTVFFVQTCVAAMATGTSVPPQGRRPRVAVVVPAHNEAAGIAATLRSVREQLVAGDRLVVVAHNCSDDTAGVASSAGAEVLVLNDPARRGKGYALDFGVGGLRDASPETVVIIDADCTLAANCIDNLARASVAAQRPAQALNLMQAPPGSKVSVRLAELAWITKNQVRPLGFRALGLPCQLLGTGMAIPWGQISTAPVASGHIVEDLQLGLDLATRGTPAIFCPSARVFGMFPAEAAIATQRTRWEHGHLSVIASRGWQLLRTGVRRGNLPLVAMALDLCVPPLAFLALLLGIALLAAMVLWAVTGDTVPLRLALTAVGMLGIGVLVSWWRFGRHIVRLQELVLIPVYMIAKIPIYFRFLRGRQTEWVRTRRSDVEER